MESVKAASEIFCPVSGKVTEKNADVEETPSLINTSCYDKGLLPLINRSIRFVTFDWLISGWLFKIELADEKDVAHLMTEEQYKEYLKSDAHHWSC